MRAVGRESKVNISGSVLINGERRSMHSYRRVIGFVPQDDVLHENLSPKEVRGGDWDKIMLTSWHS